MPLYTLELTFANLCGKNNLTTKDLKVLTKEHEGYLLTESFLKLEYKHNFMLIPNI
jgi:hypothetical protein